MTLPTRWFAVALACAVGAAPAFSQDPGPGGAETPPPVPAPAPQDPVPPTDDAAGTKPDPKKPAPKDRVITVYLKNGNIMRGYALDSRLFEREIRVTASQVGRVAFKAQEAYEPVNDAKVPGAGIRVWYHNNIQGFLFISYTQIQKVEAGRVLTKAEQDKLFAAIRAKEARIAQAAAKLRAESAAKDEAEAALRRAMIEESIAKSKGVTVEDDRQRREALLAQFPPSDGPNGWNAARKAAVERKLTVLGIVPTAEEQEFLKVYRDWAQAKAEADRLGWAPPGEATPGETPPGETPPAETPPAETPPAETPPADGGETGGTGS